MSTTKRLGKRSILGTRVGAPFAGHYHSGVIQSFKNNNSLDTLYSVMLDDFEINNGKLVLDFKAHDLIGPGFQTISNMVLNKGQKVFITYNGREVAAIVDLHHMATDDVFLTVDLSSASPNIKHYSPIEVRRKLKECWLFKSRKSARLLPNLDYSKLAKDGYHN